MISIVFASLIIHEFGKYTKYSSSLELANTVVSKRYDQTVFI
jgi:hypothetical protein